MIIIKQQVVYVWRKTGLKFIYIQFYQIDHLYLSFMKMLVLIWFFSVILSFCERVLVT